MRRSRPVIVAAFLVLTACIPARFVRFEARELRALKVTAVTEDGVDVVLTTEVANPNPLAARIQALRYEIFIGERRVGAGQRTGEFDIAAKGRAVVDLPLRVRFADLPADLPALASSPEVAYRAVVVVDATSRLGRHHFELDRRGQVRVADALKLTVAGDFALKVVRPRGVRLRPALDAMVVIADVEVRNVFPFPLEIRRVDYAVSLGGAHLADGRHETPIVIGPRATVRVALELRVPLTAVPDVLRSVSRGGVEVRVRGKVALRPIAGIAEVPFDVRLDPATLRQ